LTRFEGIATYYLLNVDAEEGGFERLTRFEGIATYYLLNVDAEEGGFERLTRFEGIATRRGGLALPPRPLL